MQQVALLYSYFDIAAPFAKTFFGTRVFFTWRAPIARVWSRFAVFGLLSVELIKVDWGESVVLVCTLMRRLFRARASRFARHAAFPRESPPEAEEGDDGFAFRAWCLTSCLISCYLCMYVCMSRFEQMISRVFSCALISFALLLPHPFHL